MNKNRMIHKNDEIKRRFYQVDKLLLENPKYKNLSEGAVLTWSILRDRMELSKQNSDVYSDEEGYLFLIFTDEELGEITHRTRKTANTRKKELEKFELLYNVRMGNNEPNRLYLLEPETCDPSEYISAKYRQKKEAERVEKRKEKEKSQKEKHISITFEVSENKIETIGRVRKSKKGTSVDVKKVHPNEPKLPSNDIESIETDLNDTEFKNLNPNHIDIYDLLWNTNIPSNLKNRVKVMIANKIISLTPDQILAIEDAYHYQIKKGYIIPDCDFDYSGAINDVEFSNTVTKMLEQVKDIRNIKGLIKEWTQLAFEHKVEQY